ncbi:MAG TPA: pyrroloquinoline quinone biosynthesis peptide chaperone PqqD [Burkholderiales bacterium]|nr:pyrroloquinoline quinone biosynthesis peptide chaperone PqqD [Burkholderiales bacterium]
MADAGAATFGEDTVFEVHPQYRFQWEPVPRHYVLLFAEGQITLPGSSGEIMKRVDGARSVGAIIEDLQAAFPGTDLRGDVIGFLEHVHGKGWIRPKRGK